MSIENTFRTLLDNDVKKLIQHEKAVLSLQDTEALHQMRVSLRRMRSVLFIFSSIIPKKITKKMYMNLSIFASSFDKARDIDVYIGTHLNKNELTSAERFLYKIVSKYKEKEYKKIKKILQSRKYKKFKKELKKWIKTKKWRKKLSKKELFLFKKNITPFATHFLNSYKNEIILYASGVGQTLGNEQAHKLRIKLKKLRYATDFFSAFFKNKLDDLQKILKELQDILGEIHDIYIAKELHKIFLHVKKSKKIYALIQKIELENTHKKEKLQEAFFIKWKLFIKIAQ